MCAGTDYGGVILTTYLQARTCAEHPPLTTMHTASVLATVVTLPTPLPRPSCNHCFRRASFPLGGFVPLFFWGLLETAISAVGRCAMLDETKSKYIGWPGEDARRRC